MSSLARRPKPGPTAAKAATLQPHADHTLQSALGNEALKQGLRPDRSDEAGTPLLDDGVAGGNTRETGQQMDLTGSSTTSTESSESPTANTLLDPNAQREEEEGEDVTNKDFGKFAQLKELDPGKLVSDSMGGAPDALTKGDPTSLGAKQTVTKGYGKNKTDKRSQQSDGEVLPAWLVQSQPKEEGAPADGPVSSVEEEEAAKQRNYEADQRREQEAAERERAFSAAGAYERDGVFGVLRWGWAKVDQATRVPRRSESFPVGVRGKENPETAGGDGGPAPAAIEQVDQPKATRATERQKRRRMVGGPDAGGEKVRVDPKVAIERTMKQRTSNNSTPTEDEPVSTAPPSYAPGTVGPMPLPGGPGTGRKPDGTIGPAGPGKPGDDNPVPTTSTTTDTSSDDERLRR